MLGVSLAHPAQNKVTRQRIKITDISRRFITLTWKWALAWGDRQQDKISFIDDTQAGKRSNKVLACQFGNGLLFKINRVLLLKFKSNILFLFVIFYNLLT